MQYQSIIRFFEYAHIEYRSAENFNLTRARKLVQAEFSMQDDGFVVIDGFSYSKNDVLIELERPDFVHRLEEHLHIWENKSLLDLLEKDAVNFSQRPDWYYLSFVPSFKAFVSPYFAPVFDRVMRGILAKNNLKDAAIWMDYIYLVEPDEEEHALKNVRFYLVEAAKFFRNLNDQSFKSRDAELVVWYRTNWSAFINKLPDSLLGYVDELITAIISFTVRIQKASRKICYLLSKEMTLVTNANYTLTKLVRSNHEIYKKNYKKRSVQIGNVQLSPFSAIYIGVILLIFLFNIIGGSFSNDKNITTPPPEESNAFTSSRNVDLDAYKAIRNDYISGYKKQFNAGGKDANFSSLLNKPFDGKDLYLLIDAVLSGADKLTPIIIKNNTQHPLYIIAPSDVTSLYVVDADTTIEVRRFLNLSTDLLLELGNHGDSTRLSAGTYHDYQYLHLTPKGQNASLNFNFVDSLSPGLLPQNVSSVKGAPLVISISEKADLYYFDVSGNGKVQRYYSSFNPPL
jgi:hypothetical protein